MIDFVSARKITSEITSEANHLLLINCEETVETTDFHAHFNTGRLHIKQFLKWIMSSSYLLARKIADVMKTKASARLKHFRLTMFASFSNPKLLEIGTEQVWQVLQASFAVASYEYKILVCESLFIPSSSPDSIFWHWTMGTSFFRLFSTCTNRSSCYVGHWNPISSRHSNGFPQYSPDIESY